MTLPLLPHTFQTSEPLSLHEANENLIASSRDVGDNLSKRYTRSSITFDLAGLTNASSQAARQFALGDFLNLDANDVLEIEKVELVIFTSTAVTWTVTSTAHTPTSIISLLTTASATTRSYAANYTPATYRGATSNVILEIAGSGASTISAGWLVVHVKSDRGFAQGVTSHAGYAPTLLTSASATAGSTLDTQLEAFEDAVERDTNNSRQVGYQGAYSLVAVDAAAPPAADYLRWRLPSMGRQWRTLTVAIVAPATATATFTLLDETGATVSARAAVGTGAGTFVYYRNSFSDTQPDDPTDSADDYILQASFSGTGTVEKCYALLTWR